MTNDAHGIQDSGRPLSYEQRMWRWRILIATYFAYVGYYLTRKTFSIAKTSIAREFDWDLHQVAHILTAYLVAYVFGQFISSFVGRKWGPRVLLLGGLGLSILFNLVFGFTNSYTTFLSFMFFNGLVQATGWAGSVGGVAHWLRRTERGSVMGIWSTSYLIGNMIVKSFGGFLLGHWGWRWSFFGCTLISFGIWWLIYFWQRTRPEHVGLEPIVDPRDLEGSAVTTADAGDTSLGATARDYFRVAFNPVIITMGLAYFCIKFMRYALDSWLPAFLDIQGLDPERASYYSQIFDFAGLAGVLLAGWALDRIFRGNWERLCVVMGLGMVVGYITVITFGADPYALALCFGLVGFMLYGPDTILCGAAAVEVAGNVNAVAVAAIVNGIGSIGAVLQEEVIGWLVSGKDIQAGMRNANLLALSMSVAFVVLMAGLTVYLARKRAQAAPPAGASPA